MQKALDSPSGITGEEKDAAAASTASPHVMSASEYKKNHFKTEGEKKFDTRAYRFWGYYVNVAVSLIAVWWAERTHMGQNTIKGLGSFFKRFGINQETAEYLGTKSFFLAGGFLVIPPIKWLENKKLEHVKKYNRQIYGDKADTDPKIVKSEQEIAAQPKQGWPSVISARLLALVPFYITVGALWSHKSPLAKLTNSNIRGLKKAEVSALEQANPEKFAGGIFFDRPITWVSRWIGRIVAWATGNKDAYNHIKHLQETTPAIMRSFHGPGCDPMLSTGPYYFISEAITSAMVAWGVFVISRVTGPFFGASREQKREWGEHRQTQKQPNTVPHPVPGEQSQAKKRDDTKPQPNVELVGLERQQASATAAVQPGR